MDINKLLKGWLYEKKEKEKVLEIGKTKSSSEFQGNLYRVWRLEQADIEDAMNRYNDFLEHLTDNEKDSLNSDEDVVLGEKAVKYIVKYIIDMEALSKEARSHSKTLVGCKQFIDTHAEQISFPLPYLITKVENSSGLDLTKLSEILKADSEIIAEFEEYEEVLSSHDYSQDNYRIEKLPDIKIYYNGMYQVVI